MKKEMLAYDFSRRTKLQTRSIYKKNCQTSSIIWGKIQNNRFIPFIYELDDREEWDKEECWEKANPGLGPIKSYDYLRQMVQKAKDDPTFKPTVLVKDFNLKQTAELHGSVGKISIMKNELGIKIPVWNWRV